VLWNRDGSRKNAPHIAHGESLAIMYPAINRWTAKLKPKYDDQLIVMQLELKLESNLNDKRLILYVQPSLTPFVS
ncbi:MAG: hypothetical protein H7641_01740, partial [Candidatus Heimdallarchaeota archaeon]|nr:hypothetical protein [Candidatus Heimdallarchaeota archaeon]MCK4876285.1 hypothetical protein [Candidatus Heimdallarchaeota archaeon]